MSVSVANLALEHKEYIEKTLKMIEIELHPSVMEDEEMVRRALFAVRNKSVLFERYMSVYAMLYTTVQDVRNAEVTVDFRFETITCSCPQKDWCRHKVSVILSLYQYIGSVQDWVSKWRAKNTVSLQHLANDRTPTNWLKMVDEVLGTTLQNYGEIPSHFYSTILENTLEKLKRHLPFEREWQPIFHLFMELAVLNKFWQHVTDSKVAMHADYLQSLIDRRIDKMQDYVYEMAGKSRLFATDPFFDAMQEMVREILLERKGYFDRKMNLYLMFWNHVFVETRRVEKELQYFQNLREVPILANKELSSVNIVFNVFYIKLKQYEALQENVRAITTEEVGGYLGLARFAFSNGDERAAEIILRAILPYLENFIQKQLQPMYRYSFINKIHSLYEKIDLTEAEEMALYSSFGKEGIQPYSKYLLKQKRYTEWAALHQMYPTSIAYLENCGLKEVLDEAPEETLPLFHFYAMAEIRQKSRINYKQAVRIWKKMKSAAKKCGKTNFWSEYIFTIRDQHRRLRALQEELEKGNLLV